MLLDARGSSTKSQHAAVVLHGVNVLFEPNITNVGWNKNRKTLPHQRTGKEWILGWESNHKERR